MAQLRLRNKTAELVEALQDRFREHHAFLARMHLDLIDQHTAAIAELTERIEMVVEPFRGFRELICSIPGISTRTAEVIIAETGADLSRFPTAGHLASWAGVCPGHHQSAGRVKSTATRHGNPYLKAALGTAAVNAARSKDSYLAARYRRLAARRGKAKAVVALQHTILTIIWTMAHTGELYQPEFRGWWAHDDCLGGVCAGQRVAGALRLRKCVGTRIV